MNFLIPDKITDVPENNVGKMPDNEIVKALECCILGDCQGCFYGDTDQRHCKDDLIQNALDLINRLQAENSKLKKSNRNWRRKVQRLRNRIGMGKDK